MARPKKKKIISEGGYTNSSVSRNMGFNSGESNTIILQMPELFYFDMRSYISSLNAAKSIDFYSRVRLYDMYESALLDCFLGGIIEKRRTGVSRIKIEFRRDGKPVDEVNEQIRSPWFRKFVKDLVMTKFYGYGLYQFYRGDDNYIHYYHVPYKHFDPIKRQILRNQTDNTGIPIEEFSNTLYVCPDGDRDLGILSNVLPMVLYKRGNYADWAQFCQIFGMPIREYTYDAGDEEARQRLLSDARNQGANAVYIHPKESTLNLIEAAGKSGTVDLYERFKDSCNKEMAIRILGNTLTTDAQKTGTQSLGTVHQDEEDMIKADDRDFVLDTLNYDMTDIFDNLGINTQGGEFVYMEKRNINPNQQVDVIAKARAMGVPVSDDYIYDTLQIDKPDDYEQQKKDIKAKEASERLLRESMAQQLEVSATSDEHKKTKTDNLYNRLKGFFSHAPNGALPF